MKSYLSFIVLLVFVACSSGKANPEVSPGTPIMPKPKSAMINEEDPNGSLWRGEGSVGSFFLDTKASKVGDILTVIVQEEATAKNQASTDLGKQSEVNNDIGAMAGMSNVWNKLPWDLAKKLNPTISASSRNDFRGNGSTSRSDNLEARISVQIVEIMPTGNFAIEGQREITVNNEKQTLRLRGIVRPQDVRIDNTVLSSFIAEADIEYSGSGVISDKQRPGWMSRFLDWVWPF